MITHDLKRLLQKLNDHTTRALEASVGFSIARGHYEVTLEHLFLKLLEDGGGDLPQILDHFGIEQGQVWDALLKHIEAFRTGNTGRPAFAPTLLQHVESAWVVASLHHGLSEIRSGTLLGALLQTDGFTGLSYAAALQGVKRDDLRDAFFDIVAGSTEDAPHQRRTGQGTGPTGVPQEGETALDLYTKDHTGEAREGKIDTISGRDQEIRQIIDILSRRRKNNPILVGEPGVGKSAVVEGLALRIAEGDVPDSLKEVEIRGLDLGLLQAGAGVKGEFEQRLKSVIEEVRAASKPVILFIDEAHTLIGAGGAAGTSDAANLLKPALARGELRTIAATTWSEYKKYIEKDAALERRFQMVKIDEPSVENAVIMLRGIKGAYEAHHGLPISDDAVRAAAELAERFIAGRFLPDKAVDLLDTSAARVKMARTATPPPVDDRRRQLAYLEKEIESVRDDLKSGVGGDAVGLGELEARREAMAEELATLEARWAEEKTLVDEIDAVRAKLNGNGASTVTAGATADAPAEVAVEATTDEAGDGMPEAAGGDGEATGASTDLSAPALLEALAAHQAKLAALQEDREPLVTAEVDAAVTAAVVSDWTGIPVGAMEKDEAATLLTLEDRLKESILGQDEVINEIADSIRTAKSGLRNPDAPTGVFLFVGPSGVGKTECARTIAELIFGGERFLTTINMSEYQESHTVSQLKGSPPGYVGYGEGGILTEAVRRQPYSVVLLDEVEKAHRDVMNLFYQVFDKGFMRDGEGREVSFKNTIVMMTSNLASDTISYVCTEDERPGPDALRKAIHETLADWFQPALLGRMKVVPFYPLMKEPMKGIVRIKLGRINKRLQQAHGVAFTYADDVVDRIAERCTQVDTGARNIDFIIDRDVLPAASRQLISRMADEDMPEALALGLDEAGNFTYDFT